MKPAADSGIQCQPDRGLMLDRRALIGAGVALGAAAMVSPILRGGTIEPSGPIHVIITNGRIAESRRFAASLSANGAQVLDVQDGLTTIWLEHLTPLWRKSSGAAVGLTTRAVWDGLSQQAIGQFRKPRILGTHEIAGNGLPIGHIVDVPASSHAALMDGAMASAHWPERMAQAVNGCLANQRREFKTCRLGSAADHQQARARLVSWMIV
ncbi:hypothetical protein GCM10011494_20130 [Novosphingobium endophyticum]|uniref:Uncharacterized protein n=1 Tax=Novosphingobium endophyticum TaxID=1955250 RepID=A0A916TS95_9SPHN|nr:hypothetical protein [Novosphingobium endophyticum]GGC01510.1 hypothetical protein GCM10011494_20130 [Novosphingobium endophyticum]